MSNEIKAPPSNPPIATGPVYAIVYNDALQIWSGTAWAADTIGNRLTGQAALALVGVFWLGNFPATIITAGTYTVIVYQQTGAAPALSDTAIYQGTINWTGATEQSPGAIFFTPILGGFVPVQPVISNFATTQFSARSYSWMVVDAAGNPESQLGKVIEFAASTAHGSKVISYSTSTTPGNISINGTGNNIIIVTFAPGDTANARNLLYTIWDTTNTPADLDLFNGALAINAAVQP